MNRRIRAFENFSNTKKIETILKENGYAVIKDKHLSAMQNSPLVIYLIKF